MVIIMNFDALQIKQKTNGMLSVEAYQEIFDCATRMPSGNIVEIGTAHGAATIALALGVMHRPDQVNIKTVDKITGGSREDYGDLETNKAIILNNFKAYNVENNIELIIGTSEEAAQKLPDDFSLGLLMLDADGAIDRDFEFFYNNVVPGGTIIIDDYADIVRVKKQKGGCHIDQKHKLTFALVSFYEKQGLLDKDKIVDQTYFARKPLAQKDPVDFMQYDVRPLYRSLIFSDGYLVGQGAQTKMKVVQFISRLTSKYPGVHNSLRKIYKKLRS